MPETALVIQPSSELAGLFDPRASGTLSGEERTLISALLSNDDRVDIAIPADITSESLWETLYVCCKVSRRVGKVQTVLKMLVGRALVIMESRPEMYKNRGFESLDSFMSSEADNGLQSITGISRSELYNAKANVKTFPSLPIDKVREIGMSKLKMIGKVTQEGSSDAPYWIEKARTETMTQLRESIYRSEKGIEPGSLEQDVVTFTVTKAEKDQIQEFVADARFQAIVGSPLPGPILCQAIAEASTEWLAQAEESERPN